MGKIPLRKDKEFSPGSLNDSEGKFAGTFPQVSDYDIKKFFYGSLLKTFEDEAKKRLKDGLTGILVYGDPGKDIEQVEEDLDIAVVIRDDYTLKEAREGLSQVREFIENHEKNRFDIEIDGVVLPESNFEKKLKRIIGMAPKPCKISNLNSWLTQHAETSPSFHLLPWFQKDEYLVNKIKEAKKEAIEEPPGDLDKYRF